MNELWWAVKGIAACAGLILLAYAVARAASFGYFRTKSEHHRRMMADLKKEKD